MNMGAAIFAFLSENLSIGERVHPLSLPQKALAPAIAFKRISDVPVLTHDNAQSHPLYDGTLYVVSRYQFDCYGETYDDAEALADELVAVASGYSGMWGDVRVDRVDPDARVDDWDEGPKLYRVMQDLFIGHHTAAES